MPTLISYEQLSKTWKVVAGGAVSLLAIGGVVVLMQGKNAAGIVTYKDFSDGSRQQSGSLLIRSGSTTIHADAITNRLGVGMSNPRTRLEVLGTTSGTDIYASRNVSGSSIYAQNSITGTHLYFSGTFGGAGMVDCDADNQTLNWDTSTKQFVCGDDDSGGGTGGSSPEVGTSSFSGATLRLSDARYVQKQGDTMTGSLNVRATLSGQTLVITGNGSFTGKLVVAKSISGAALEVLGTASGQNVYATSSVTGSHLYAVTTFAGAGLADCDTSGTSKLLWDSATKRFSCGTDSNTTYNFGQGLTSNGTNIRLSDAHSGSIINASATLSSSGTLVVEGAMSGASLFVGTSISGIGLVDCDTPGPSKVLYDITTGRFSCGTDQNTPNTPEVGTITFSGGVLRLGDTRYLRTAGGTMTGMLTIDLLTGWKGLNIIETATGNIIHAEKDLSSSGTLTVNGRAAFRNTLSGNVVRTEKTLASSGTLVWEGQGSGSRLTLGGGNITVSLSGQTVFNALSRNVDLIVNGQTLANLIDVDASANQVGIGTGLPKALLDVAGTLSGRLLTISSNATVSGSIIARRTIQAGNTLASSGSLAWEGIGSGTNLHVSSTLSASGRIVTDGTMSGFVVRYGSISPQVKQAMIYASGSTIAVGSGRYLYVVPRTMSGYKLGEVHVKVQTAGTTNTSTFRFRNVTKNNRHLLTVPVSIDSGELGSDTAATAYTIAPNPDVGAYDTLSFDIATVSTTAPKGLMFTFMFYKP